MSSSKGISYFKAYETVIIGKDPWGEPLNVVHGGDLWEVYSPPIDVAGQANDGAWASKVDVAENIEIELADGGTCHASIPA